MSALPQRVIDFAEKAGRDLRLVHTRIDGELETAEKLSLAGAINELAERVPINISVGMAPPANPSVNDLWIDTGA